MMKAPNPFRWFAKGIALVTLIDLRAALAQNTNATCTLSSLQWSFNSQNQSPCAIASTLLGVCDGGEYDVLALPQDTAYYLGPPIDAANPCQCNTVVYSLMSACALCQNGTITTWSQWATDCATVFDESYPRPIPDGLHVPAYAYLSVEAQDIFDESSAQQDSNATESTALPSSTSTTTTQTSPMRTSPVSATGSTTPNNARINAISSGVVGGVIGFTCLLLLGITASIKRRNLRALRSRRSSEEDALGGFRVESSPATSEQSSPADSMSEVNNGATIQMGRSPYNAAPAIEISSSSDDVHGGATP